MLIDHAVTQATFGILSNQVEVLKVVSPNLKVRRADTKRLRVMRERRAMRISWPMVIDAKSIHISGHNLGSLRCSGFQRCLKNCPRKNGVRRFLGIEGTGATELLGLLELSTRNLKTVVRVNACKRPRGVKAYPTGKACRALGKSGVGGVSAK